MSYRKAQFQKRVPPNKIRYDFDTYVNGSRIRERIICTRSEVAKRYAEWLDRIHAYKKETQQLQFFETFARYLAEFTSIRKKDKQVNFEYSFFEKRLEVFFKNCILSDIRRSQIEQYVAWRMVQKGREGKISASAVNHDVNILSSFFSWCIRHDLYEFGNPCSGMKIRDTSRRNIRLSGIEFSEILEKALDYGELYTVVLIALMTGLRKGEILTLQWNDIDFNHHEVRVRSEVSKTSEERLIPMPDILYNHLIHRKKDEKYVIGLRYDAVRSRFEKLRNRLSFKDKLPGKRLLFHDLRHIYAQALRDADVPLDDIGAFLGHSDPKITRDRYAQRGGYNGLEKVNKLNKIISQRLVNKSNSDKDNS